MILSSRGAPCKAGANSVARWSSLETGGLRCLRVNQLVVPSTLRQPRISVGSVDRNSIVCNAVEAVSEAEQKANEKRWEESGKDGDSNEWKWTLNWDDIMDNIVVGSCPRSPQDLDRMAEEAGATAVLSLQCDLCLEALEIDWEAIRDHAVEKGVAMTRVPIRDFDHGDQTLMLPEAVRTLAMLLAMNHRVYVHCTAGINRATLTVLGYLTFVKGQELHSALALIKGKRSQAHPYVDCWKSTKARLLQGRMDEVVALARSLAKELNSKEEDSFSNWVEAENRLIQETFRRQLACSLSFVSSMTELKAAQVSSVCIMPEEMDKAQEEITSLKKDLEEERGSLRMALVSLENGNSLVTTPLEPPIEDESKSESCYAAFTELAEAHNEIAALRQGLREIAETSVRALRDQPANKSSPMNVNGNGAEIPMADIEDQPANESSPMNANGNGAENTVADIEDPQASESSPTNGNGNGAATSTTDIEDQPASKSSPMNENGNGAENAVASIGPTTNL